MQRIFSAIALVFRSTVMIFSSIVLVGISSLFIFTAAPSFASTNNSQTIPQTSQSETSYHNLQTPQAREKAYDKAAKAIQDPEGLDKIYEENVKKSEKTQSKDGILEAAEDFVENITGNK